MSPQDFFQQDPFKDIRPYNDDEFHEVVARIANNPRVAEAVARSFSSSSFVMSLLKPFISWRVKSRLSSMEHIGDFQLWLSTFVEKMLKTTTDGFTVSGLDDLAEDDKRLWISNHRDIALDPTLVNYALHLKGLDTGRIAIGDNLLIDSLVADLMRLNKSFIVPRSVKSKREKLDALKLLSKYITHSIETGHSVWLAQQEGRAKDGKDETDTAVLKMLSLSGRGEGKDFSQALQSVKPIPVTISYEYDPCDLMKARELAAKQAGQDYQKDNDEDVKSILEGIKGQKGRIHVAFGKPIKESDFANANLLKEEIDRQILAGYELFPVNYAAYSLLQKKSLVPTLDNMPQQELEKNINWLNERARNEHQDVKQQLLFMYAEPVLQSQK